MGLTVEEIAKVLKAKAGNVSESATALKVTRQALYKRIEADEELHQIVKDARESLVDVAESALLKQVKRGNTAAIIFALKTQGKSRGYVERSEHHHRIEDVSKLSDDELRAIVES